MRSLLNSCLLIAAIVAASPALSEPLDARRAEIQAAFAAAERGELTLADVARLQSHPLSGWLEVLVRERDLARLDREGLTAVLEALGPQPAANRLRTAWLRRAAAENRWQDLLAHYREPADTPLQCAALQARAATGSIDTAWTETALALWLSADSQPAACDPVFATLAQRGELSAERQLEALATLLPKDSREHGAVRAAIALWTAASYGAESARRLAAVPLTAYDDALHGWAVREPLSRNDLAGALAAIERMPAALRGTAQWQYFEARLREDLGQPEAATPLFAAAARSPTFHGFLAADRAGTPYALCPREVSSERRLVRDVERNAALVRAIELFRIKRPAFAALEWQAAVAGMDDARRLIAVARAVEAGWTDRALFGLPATPDSQAYYRLRFPLPHESLIRREARRNGLEPSLVAALTRAESAFMVEARSPANARGLMQLLPSTAEGVARRLGQPWQGPDSLFNPTVNVPLGTAYLAQRIGDNGGLAYRAIAAYNAGQGAVQRWVAARPALPTDYWIETIPFRETREYVPRVLAFSVIYDWRLEGHARPLTDRLEGRPGSDRRDFACPEPAALPPSPPAN